MARLLVCTGKKNKVSAVLQHYITLDKKKLIKILGHKIATKRALIWSYDELKILYENRADGKSDGVPKGLRKSLDLCSIKESTAVIVRFSSFQEEDPLLKPKVLALSRPFLSKQVSVKAQVEEFRHSEYRIEHKCSGQITGPANHVLAYKELLIKEKLCDPKSVSYIF